MSRLLVTPVALLWALLLGMTLFVGVVEAGCKMVGPWWADGRTPLYCQYSPWDSYEVGP